MVVRIGVLCAVLMAVIAVVGCEDRSGEPPGAGFGEGHVRVSDEVELYYQVVGTGQDTLVVVHGGAMGLPLDYLAPDLEPLARSHVLIFYDQRGAGRSTIVSEPARMQVANHVADLEELRLHFGMSAMKLIGHSWGAGLTARYAAEYPDHVSQLVLMGPMAIRNTPYTEQFSQAVYSWMDPTIQAEVERLSQAMLEADREADLRTACREFWRLFMRGYLADPQDVGAVDQMRGDMCAGSVEGLRDADVTRGLTYEALGDWDWSNDFGHVAVPVLVIHGRRDPIPLVAAEEWTTAFPNARLLVIEGAGHYPHFERPVEFFAAVEEFLR